MHVICCLAKQLTSNFLGVLSSWLQIGNFTTAAHAREQPDQLLLVAEFYAWKCLLIEGKERIKDTFGASNIYRCAVIGLRHSKAVT